MYKVQTGSYPRNIQIILCKLNPKKKKLVIDCLIPFIQETEIK